MSQVTALVDVARQAVVRHSWREAYDAYSGSDEPELTPHDLERFADAAWWTGGIDQAMGLRERSYTGFSAAGDKLGAARLALTRPRSGSAPTRETRSRQARVFTDYGGQSVHMAARIGAAAAAGEVLVSRETLDGIETAFRLSEPRVTSLKGFGEPMEVVSVDWR